MINFHFKESGSFLCAEGSSFTHDDKVIKEDVHFRLRSNRKNTPMPTAPCYMFRVENAGEHHHVLDGGGVKWTSLVRIMHLPTRRYLVIAPKNPNSDPKNPNSDPKNPNFDEYEVRLSRKGDKKDARATKAFILIPDHNNFNQYVSRNDFVCLKSAKFPVMLSSTSIHFETRAKSNIIDATAGTMTSDRDEVSADNFFSTTSCTFQAACTSTTALGIDSTAAICVVDPSLLADFFWASSYARKIFKFSQSIHWFDRKDAPTPNAASVTPVVFERKSSRFGKLSDDDAKKQEDADKKDRELAMGSALDHVVDTFCSATLDYLKSLTESLHMDSAGFVSLKVKQKMLRHLQVADMLIDFLKEETLSQKVEKINVLFLIQKALRTKNTAKNATIQFVELADGRMVQTNTHKVKSAIYRYLALMVTGHSRKNNLYVLPHLNLFIGQVSEKTYSEEFLLALVEDEYAVLSTLDQKQIETFFRAMTLGIDKDTGKVSPSYLKFLAVICECDDRALFKNQEIVGKLLRQDMKLTENDQGPNKLSRIATHRSSNHFSAKKENCDIPTWLCQTRLDKDNRASPELQVSLTFLFLIDCSVFCLFF